MENTCLYISRKKKTLPKGWFCGSRITWIQYPVIRIEDLHITSPHLSIFRNHVGLLAHTNNRSCQKKGDSIRSARRNPFRKTPGLHHQLVEVSQSHVPGNRADHQQLLPTEQHDQQSNSVRRRASMPMPPNGTMRRRVLSVATPETADACLRGCDRVGWKARALSMCRGVVDRPVSHSPNLPSTCALRDPSGIWDDLENLEGKWKSIARGWEEERLGSCFRKGWWDKVNYSSSAKLQVCSAF